MFGAWDIRDVFSGFSFQAILDTISCIRNTLEQTPYSTCFVAQTHPPAEGLRFRVSGFGLRAQDVV